jgi:hypothetical protein
MHWNESDLFQKNLILILIFNCVLFEKLEGERLMTYHL